MNVRVDEHSPTLAAIGRRPLLRIVIVGHVDHGKSTLIGRLLHETGNIPNGKLEALRAVSARRGMPFEWSFLLDALQTERDQGITLDTSQVRFRAGDRDVLLIDAPGHAEFLRNMITGASQADAALLIIDAAEGVRDQTRRHGYLLHLLGIRQAAVIINKMDRVDYDADRFHAIGAEITAHLDHLGLGCIAVVPVSARVGDGVTRRTDALAWYDGPTVIEALDRFAPARPFGELALRLPIQAVYKFDDRRILAGRIETGEIAVGQEIVVMPGDKRARVRAIEAWPAPASSQPPRRAWAGQSIGLTLEDDIFVDRGDIVSAAAVRPQAARRLQVRAFWLHEQPLTPGASILVRIGTGETRGTVASIDKAIDPGELASVGGDAVGQNQVGEITVVLNKPLAADPASINPRTGRVVLEVDGRICGGGLVLSAESSADKRHIPADIVPAVSAVSADERARRFGHRGAVIWLTGLPASGKSTIARALERRLFDLGGAAVLLDGDTMRAGLNSDLGFSAADRSENVRRLAELAGHLSRSGLIAVVAAVSPAAADRAQARRIVGERFYEIHVDAPVEACRRRDPKGHYARADKNEIADFTGVASAYEPPVEPDLRIDTARLGVTAAVAAIEGLLAGSAAFNVSGRALEFTM